MYFLHLLVPYFFIAFSPFCDELAIAFIQWLWFACVLSCLSCVPLFVTLWTVAHESMGFCPWDSPGKNTGMSCRALLQGIFPTQGSKPGLPHCRRFFTIWATRAWESAFYKFSDYVGPGLRTRLGAFLLSNPVLLTFSYREVHPECHHIPKCERWREGNLAQIRVS